MSTAAERWLDDSTIEVLDRLAGRMGCSREEVIKRLVMDLVGQLGTSDRAEVIEAINGIAP